MGWNISIHAPAKGATLMDSETLFSLKHFNPRSRKGSDVRLRFCVHCSKSFQSTLPQRERRYSFARFPVISLISIHAPAKGATGTNQDHPVNSSISIHAPAKGATSASQCHRCARPAISIHAPAKGATHIIK